jgi:hypothetical protein
MQTKSIWCQKWGWVDLTIELKAIMDSNEDTLVGHVRRDDNSTESQSRKSGG